jgi:hypothetical protein
MPAVAAHFYFGEQVLELLTGDIKILIEKHKPAFNLGLQGPDLLFYYKLWKKNEIVDMGHELHRQPADIFICRALKNIKAMPNLDAQAYMLGFACHHVLDSTFHGRIAQLAPQEREHRLLEAELDRQIADYYPGCTSTKFKRHQLAKIRTNDFEWMKLIYPELSLEALKNCATSFAFFTWLLGSRNSLIKGLMEFAEKVLHREGDFTSMILRKECNEIYYEPAREIRSQMSGVTAAGAEAVKNVFSCFKEECALAGSFEKNFL